MSSPPKSFNFLVRTLTHNPQCFVGFDGFIDEIIHPIAKREGTDYVRYPTILEFSKYLKNASHKSCNVELAVQEIKIGGNGPLLANALANLGYPLVLAGTFGKKSILPIFETLVKKCRHTITLGDPGHSDALEFPEGKIILGKMEPVHDLTYKDVIQKIGAIKLKEFLDHSTLFVSANWTMMPMMNDLWEHLLHDIAPKLSVKKRYMFVDIADPAKRSDEDLKKALNLLKNLNQFYSVVLGLNYSEGIRIAKTLKLKKAPSPEELIQSLYKKLKLSIITLHNSKFSFACDSSSLVSHTPYYTPEPKTTTGAGDNFNAGFCHGLLQGKSLQETLITANGTAGFFVRKGTAPSVEELAIFLHTWDNIKE